MRSLGWTLATTVGFVLGGVALHAPGASGIGATYLDWDVSAAVFGAIFGSVVGIVTGLLQMVALGRRSWRLLAATVVAVAVAVAVAHALADGAPAAWGVVGVAAFSGLCAAVALAVALRVRAWQWIIASAFAWFAGWSLGVTIAGVLRLSGGTTRAPGRPSTRSSRASSASPGAASHRPPGAGSSRAADPLDRSATLPDGEATPLTVVACRICSASA